MVGIEIAVAVNQLEIGSVLLEVLPFLTFGGLLESVQVVVGCGSGKQVFDIVGRGVMIGFVVFHVAVCADNWRSNEIPFACVAAVTCDVLFNRGEALEILYYMNGVGDVNEKIRFCDEAIKKSKYNSAISSKNNKAYQRAIDVFTSIIDYRDSKEQIEECKNLSKYQNAMELKAAKYYVQARKKFEEIKDFKDSLDQIEYCNRGLIIESKKSKIIKIVIGIVASLLIIVPLVIWLISFA